MGPFKTRSMRQMKNHHLYFEISQNFQLELLRADFQLNLIVKTLANFALNQTIIIFELSLSVMDTAAN